MSYEVPIGMLIALRCVVNEDTGCWEWQGQKDKDGYGKITHEGVTKRTHREAFLETGRPLIGMACHHCDNPACCNPGHMYDGDATTNMTDMQVRRRGAGMFKKGHDHPFSKLTSEQVAAIRAAPKVYGSGKQLANLYGVSSATISEIRSGTIYVE